MRYRVLLPILVIVIAAAGVSYWYTTQRRTAPTPQNPSRLMSIVQRNSAAFGVLDSSKQSAAPQSTAGTETTADAKLIAPSPGGDLATVTYDYTGSTFEIPAIPVLKRTPGFTDSQLATILNGVHVDLFSVGALTNASVQQLTLTEGKENGYTVTVDALDGSVSLYRATQAGDVVALKGAPEAITRNANTPAATTLPADDTLITVANQFLSAYGIPHDDYGTPTVDRSYFPFGVATPSSLYPAPPSVSVTYPLVVQGTPVVSWAGYPVGLSVSVNATTQAVENVSNLRSLRYEASQYALTDDVQKVINLAKSGGLYGQTSAGRTSGSTDTTVHVQLGAPVVRYVSTYYQLDGTSAEYLVPAMVFPIANVPVGLQLYQSAVVVPLVQELVNQPATILPADAASGSSGSSTGSMPVAL